MGGRKEKKGRGQGKMFLSQKQPRARITHAPRGAAGAHHLPSQYLPAGLGPRWPHPISKAEKKQYVRSKVYKVDGRSPLHSTLPLAFPFKTKSVSPGWRGSASWASSHEAKGHRLDSRPEHVPGWRVQSPGWGACEMDRCFPPTSMFISLSLQTNK